MAAIAQADPSVVLRNTRGIRVVLCDPDEGTRAELRKFIESDPLLTVAGEAEDWRGCQSEVEDLVPELLIVRAELLPAEWRARNAEDAFGPVVLPLMGRDEPAGNYRTAGVSIDPWAIRSSLNRALTEIYDRKAKQLLYLVGRYVAASDVVSRYAQAIRTEGDGRPVEVPAEAVIAILAARKHVVVQTAEGSRRVHEPIHRVIETLDPSIFVRIHRSVIINSNHLDLRATTSKSNHVVMKDGSRYPVGRNYRDAFAAQLQRLCRFA